MNAWPQTFSPADRRPIQEWAADNCEMPAVLTKRGKFDLSNSRQFIAPLNAVHSDRVREVNIQAPVRDGKTLIASIGLQYFIANENASCLCVYQDDREAGFQAEERIWPMLEHNPTIVPLLPANRHKKRTQDILLNNGMPLIVSGPSLGNLQGKGFKFVHSDEAWMYKRGVLAQLKGRLGDYAKIKASKFVGTSQAGEDGCDWDIQVQSGELNLWNVPCLGCGKMIYPKWTDYLANGDRAGIVFDSEKDKDGRYNVQKVSATVRFVCPKCGHVHPDSAATRAAWNERGDYVITGEPNEEIKSFIWSAIITYPWALLVKIFLSAKVSARSGSYDNLVVFWQKYMAETKSVRTVHEAKIVFAKPSDSSEKGDLTPALRICTVDVQEDHFWVMIRDWWYGGKSIGVQFVKVFSWTEVTETWTAAKIQAQAVWIDSGHRPKGVNGAYAYAILNGCFTCKGDKERSYTWTRRAGPKEIRYQKSYAPPKQMSPECILPTAQGKFAYNVVYSSNSFFDDLQALIDRKMWCEEAARYGDMWDTYQKQMSSEVRRQELDKYGNTVSVWEDMSQGQNHAWDCAKMQTLAATINKLISKE